MRWSLSRYATGRGILWYYGSNLGYFAIAVLLLMWNYQRTACCDSRELADDALCFKFMWPVRMPG